MSIFAKSAHYYDAFYETKDYVAEANYVRGILEQYAPSARSILDLGCGTGRHGCLLAENGYRVVGIDRSQEMLARAETLRSSAPAHVRDRLTFRQGDVRDFRMDQAVDAVISLFHVMSYQISNDDVNRAIATAKAHLKIGGLFIFDCWYGPGVLQDPPATRIKRADDHSIRVWRIAEPDLLVHENAVDVNFRFLVADSQAGTLQEFDETHRMRYFFKPEVTHFLKANGLAPVLCFEWLKREPPTNRSWNVVFAAKKAAE